VLGRVGKRIGEVRPRVEEAVRGANLNIIQGIGASQYGIGAVTARLVEAVLRDERVVVPVGSYRPEVGVTYSLPSVVGAVGVLAVLEPQLDAEERAKLDHSIDVLRHAAQRLRRAAGA
jgi:L-lactate dehydrogenase